MHSDFFGNYRPKGETFENKQRSIICTYVAGNFWTFGSGYLLRFSICRYFSRDKEIGAWSRLAESIKESITAERRRGRRKRESRDVPLTPWNLSEFFSSPGYYNIAFLYLHRNATNIRRGVGPLRSFPLEIGSFSRTLLVAHRRNTANVNIDRLFSIVPFFRGITKLNLWYTVTEETNGREYFGLNPARARRETTVFLVPRKSISQREETWRVEIARFNRNF